MELTTGTVLAVFPEIALLASEGLAVGGHPPNWGNFLQFLCPFSVFPIAFGAYTLTILDRWTPPRAGRQDSPNLRIAAAKCLNG